MLITLFAVMIIPDDIRPRYYDNLIGGLGDDILYRPVRGAPPAPAAAPTDPPR